MKRWIIMLLVLLLTGCGAAAEEETSISYHQIGAEEAKQMMEGENEELVILDVREQEEYDEEHIPGAVLHLYALCYSSQCKFGEYLIGILSCLCKRDIVAVAAPTVGFFYPAWENIVVHLVYAAYDAVLWLRDAVTAQYLHKASA